FARAVRKPHGIVLVTGPTGSGKSTTVYSALSSIVCNETNICTVEDPIEYVLPGVNQFQVHERIKLTFPELLRALLRQDPDVIMVGEIRDPDTCRIAIQAALTGHLVLSTLHTNDAASSVARLTNLGAEPFLISASLEAVLAQRLVRKICTNCRVEVDAPPNVRAALEAHRLDVDRVFRGRGCGECNRTGTRGRVGIFELFIPDDRLRNAIASGGPVEQLRERAVEGGMKTLAESGLAKARAGETTFEEVLRVYSD
ncbi:MAG: GspE/PulE family protein, partial [Phycisphaerae bacterium]